MPGETRIQWIQKIMSDKFEAAFAKADADGSGSIGKFHVGHFCAGHFQPSLWRLQVLTLIGKFLGNFWDRFTGKLIQPSIGEFWGVTQAVLVENSSWPNVTYHIWYMVSVKKCEWMSFPVKRSVWRPGRWKFQKNFWMSFPWFANKG